MHKTCVTLNPDLGEGRDSSAYVTCFFPFGPVVYKEESFQDFIQILALVTILFSVSSKLKKIHISFTLIILCPCSVMCILGLCNLLYVLWKFLTLLHVREPSIWSPK